MDVVRAARKHHKPEGTRGQAAAGRGVAGAGKSAVEAVRAGVTEQTYYRWRAEYEGLKVKRLKLLEQENGRLRKAVADLALEKLLLKEVAWGNW